MIDGDALSSIFGWISIGCWIVVYSPQLYENYRLQSGEGLSVLFLLAWFIGDVCNLFGAILGGLVPTVIILACYYALCDFTLLAQIYYYRWKRSRWPIGPFYDLPTPNTSTTALASEATYDSDYEGEAEPLLGSTRSKVLDRPGGGEEETLGQLVLRYTLCLLLISMLGIGAWWFDEGQYGDGGDLGNEWWLRVVTEVMSDGDWGFKEWLRGWIVQLLGWTSATLYVGAHLPQILKNVETRCEGISPALFVFSTFGSFTYVISICAKSLDKDYLITNASWLVGHGLTGVLDCVVIAQIVYYRFTQQGRATTMVL